MTEHVKIYGVKPRIQYTADGTSKTYIFPFAIFTASDIDVYFADIKQEPTSYTVSSVRESDGGNVTFETAPISGTIITIVRNLSIERISDFQEGGALRANTLNDELDYQIACQQQIADNLNRSMVLPPYATDSNVDLTLPMPCAGKAIVWNQEGTNLENSTIEVNALESTLRGYKESAETASATATIKADNASSSADTALTQAGIATQKAQEAATVVSTKANTDMDNLTSVGKSAIITLGEPDYDNPIAISLPASAHTYTVPYSGIMAITMSCNGSGNWLYVRKNSSTGSFIASTRQSYNNGGFDTVTAVVKAGDVIWHERYGTIAQQVIFPFKGEE